MSVRVIGTCGLCGGQVTVPGAWFGINPPVPKCDSCHATMKHTGPILPMNPAPRATQIIDARGKQFNAEVSND